MALVKYNNNSISAVTTTGLASGSLVLIKTLTASSSGTLSFVDGTDGVVLDSTYPIYKFEFINIQPTTNDVIHQFNLSTDSGSNYNVTKTTTFFRAYHTESDSAAALAYVGSDDLAQSTAYQNLDNNGLGNGSDESESGFLTLFNPSSTTFVKHFIATTQYYQSQDASYNAYIAGYGNTTSAIDAVRFQMSSGNMNGKIKLYGIKDS